MAGNSTERDAGCAGQRRLHFDGVQASLLSADAVGGATEEMPNWDLQAVGAS